MNERNKNETENITDGLFQIDIYLILLKNTFHKDDK